ncbi:MAG: mechanosensitive ion channel family protein [Candidatus Acidiferrales bacterium]
MRLDMKTGLLFVGVLLFGVCPHTLAQRSPSTAVKATRSGNGSGSVTTAPSIDGGTGSVAAVSPSQLVDFLNQTISWYHRVTIQQETASEPDAQLTLYDNRQIAKQVVQLALEFARAQADAIDQAAPKKAASGTVLPQSETLVQMQAKLDKAYQDAQTELESDQRKLTRATGTNRRTLEATLSELQGEIDLIKARRDAVQSMAQFVSTSAANATGTAGLKTQIEALAASVPNVTTSVAQTSKSQAQTASPVSVSSAPDLSGIWDVIADTFRLSSRRSAVNALIAETNALSSSSTKMRGPFVAQLRALSSRGDQLAAQADTANQAMLTQERQQLESLTKQFRQIAAAVIPLSKQSVLLNLYGKNLANWNEVIDAQYKSDLRNLAIRLGLLAVIFGILFGLAEVWRRAVIRYVQEPRRRHQFLLIRKFSLWFVIAIILAITLAGKLGSVATFAGLLTAGVALALQNVIVSIVGYFFLIGKYGIRAGDRVQAGGTTGEVVDVGLVRFHMMELDSAGTPTGRIVALSNSIVFQPTAGLFKQIPGTSFAWHEVTATVPRQADFTALRKKLLEAAENVLRDYHDDIARQFQQIEKTGLLVSEKGLRPKVALRLSSSGVEVTIRYPVDLQHGAEIDARMSRELVTILEGESDSTSAVHVKTDVPAGSTR